MERSGLFLDAPDLLGDAAKAACGTRYRDCVSWDYAGLIKLSTAISRDRTGPGERWGARRAARRRATVAQVRNSRRCWCRTGKLGRGSSEVPLAMAASF